MLTATLRRVGGSVMLAIPRPILDELNVGSGKVVALSVEGGRILVEPRARPRYRLDELLAESGDAPASPSDEDREWHAAVPVGREIV